MQLIETIELSVEGTISIINIPQDATDILLLGEFRRTGTGGTNFFHFNEDTASDLFYNSVSLNATNSGSVTSASTSSDYRIPLLVANNNYDSNTFTNVAIYISNYTSTGTKSISIDDSAAINSTLAFNGLKLTAANYTSSDPISSIQIDFDKTAGSSVSLYKITAD